MQLTVVVTRFRFQSTDGTGRPRRNGKLSVSHEEMFQMVKSSSDTTVYGRPTWTLLYCSCTAPMCSITFPIRTICATISMYCKMNLCQTILYTHCVYIVLAFPCVYNCTIVSMCRNLCSRAATDASLVGSSTPAGATTGQLQLVCMHKHEHCFVQFVCVNEHCFVQFVCVNDHCFVQFVWLCIWSTVCVCVCVRACVRTCV